LLYIFRGVLPGEKWRALDPAGTDIMRWWGFWRPESR
jgi:hypothetical protein